MPDAQELYTSAVRDMPAEEQLRLAAIILNGLTQTREMTPDFEDEWTEEDLREATIYFMKQAEERYAEEHDLV